MKRVLVFIFLTSACFLASQIFASGTVDINTASLAQLDTLTGIGPVYAQRIIDGRPYSSVDDLLRVKGIGPATLQKIKDQGLACIACSTQEISNYSNQISNSNTQISNTAAPTYSSGVFINEILPNPQGADEIDEWIELSNINNFEVDLSGWQIQDTTGTPTTYTIPPSTSSGQASKILAGGFLVFKRPETKIMLNNDTDGLNLLTPDKKIVDSVSFTSAPLGQSYNKTSSGWAWSTTLTPGAVNIITAVAKALPATKKSVKNDGVAALSQSVNAGQIASPWFLFFTVLATTIILAAVVLFIKIKFLKNNVGS